MPAPSTCQGTKAAHGSHLDIVHLLFCGLKSSLCFVYLILPSDRFTALLQKRERRSQDRQKGASTLASVSTAARLERPKHPLTQSCARSHLQRGDLEIALLLLSQSLLLSPNRVESGEPMGAWWSAAGFCFTASSSRPPCCQGKLSKTAATQTHGWIRDTTGRAG